MAAAVEEDRLDIEPDDLTCPVCREVFVQPLLYPCGHTVCQPCAAHMDAECVRKQSSAHAAPTFRCPICRRETVVPWSRRTPNLLLAKIAEEHADFERRMKEDGGAARPLTPGLLAPKVNLAALCRRVRLSLAIDVYHKIFPILHRAARAGQSYVLVKEEGLVSDVEKTLDLLSTLVFDLGCYKVLVNPGYREATFMITRQAFRIARSYTNRQYAEVPTEGADAGSDRTQEENGSETAAAESGLSRGVFERLRTQRLMLPEPLPPIRAARLPAARD